MFRKITLQPKSIQMRLTRLILIVVMGTFLVVGVIAMIIIRSGARASLSQSHGTELAEFTREIEGYLTEVADDVRRLSSSAAARNFAGETITVASTDLEEAQQRLLGEFISLAQLHAGEFLELRYVTRSGSVWTKVTAYEGIQPDTNVYLNQLVGDQALNSSLGEPGGSVVLGPLLFLRDQTGQQITPPRPILRFSVPVASPNDNTNIPGVIQVDVSADYLLNIVNGAPVTLSIQGRRAMLIDQQEYILADTREPTDTYPRRGVPNETSSFSIREQELYQALNDQPAEFIAANAGEQIFSGAEVSLGNSPTMPWRVLLIDDAATALGWADAASLAVLALALALGGLITVVTRVLLSRMLKPLATAATLAQRLAEQGDANLVTLPQSDDELGHLIQSFDQISRHVKDLSQDLESQVGRYTRNLEIAARIGRETATLYDTDELLNRAITLIVEEFGYYHAQVFLVDDVGQFAVLFYSFGEAGRQLLRLQHKIEVGSDSVIGTVTRSGQALIVNDTRRKDAGPHLPNPLLPDTRAELALPLNIGSQIIGALDVQSTEPNAFEEEELQTFQLLADQIAVAIHNARLLQQSQDRVTQIDTLNRQLTRIAWQDVEERGGFESIYRYDLFAIEQGDKSEQEVPGRINASITIRGEAIGTLVAEPPEGLEFSDGDRAILRAVADRVALAIENARLFQETQSSLAQTSILYQISRFLNEADTLEDIVQAIIISVMPDALSGQIGVFDEFNFGELPEWMEINVDWAMGVRENQSVQLPGVHLHIPDHPILANMQPTQVTLINDVARDARLDEALRSILTQIEARSAVFVPFSVRGVWRGVILIEFPETREFGEREGRIYSTLIDQVGVAIDNRLLLRQTELALSQIERLYTSSRIINTAQNTDDLVQAAVSTTSDELLDFELAVFEGELDATGWPTRLRLVSRSDRRVVSAENTVFDIQIGGESPLRHREPQILIDRTPKDQDAPPLVRYLRSNKKRFGVAFPLFSANLPIALFFITAKEVRELTAEDYEVYRALTGQMSTVLQNRRLLEQTAQVLDETRRLYAASRAITSAQDFETVYRAAAEHLAGTDGDVSRVLLLLAGPTPGADAPFLEYQHVWSRDDGEAASALIGTRIASDQVPLARVIAQAGGASSFDDLENTFSTRPTLLALFRDAGAASVTLAPVQTGRKWLGALVAESQRGDVFDEQYVRFAQAIADQVAIAIDNRQLFEEAQSEAQRALALAEAGQLATRIGGSFEESLEEVFTRVSEPAQYDRWLLMLLDEQGKHLEMVTANMPGENEFSYDITLKSNHSIIDAVRFNRTIIINDLDSYPAFATYRVNFLNEVGKHIVTPIRSGEKVVGALLVGRSIEGVSLDERDEQLVNTLAAQVGIAVENRRLFIQAESERQTLRSTLETLPAGVLVLDPHTYKPTQFNEQAEYLLGRSIDLNTPFNAVDYNIYRTGTNVHYPSEELPIFVITDRESGPAQVDDVAVLLEDGTQVDLLMNAAPIFDIRGNISFIVAAFTDISNLRSLENTLQDNLRDTIQLYEATRALAEVDEEEHILDLVIEKLESIGPSGGYVLLLDEAVGVRVVRSIDPTVREFPLPDDVLNAQAALIVSDVRVRLDLSEETRHTLMALGVHSLVSMPLHARSRRDVPIGWLVLTYDEPRYLTPEEERFITTITDSASIALDNRYLFRSTETALNETAALYDATTSISRSRDLRELSTALQAALETIYPDMYAAYLVPMGMAEESTEMFNISLDADPANFRSLLIQHHGALVENLYIDDLRARANPGEFERDVLAFGNIRALAIVNLGIKGAAKGFLVIAYHQPHRFNDSEARFLGTLADSASVIIDNILLFDQIQTTLDETSVLYQASRALGDATTPEDVLNVVVNHLVDELTTLTFLAELHGTSWSAASAQVHIAASWQRDAENDLGLAGVNLTAEQFPAWRQLSTPTILMVNDVETDETMTMMERLGVQSLDVRSLAIIPLRSGRHAIGSILLGSRDARRYSERDLRVYQSFAEQASLKMEAARLLQQTERRATQLATSAEVSRAASTILDLTVLLPRLVDLIRDSFHYDHVQIFLMDVDDDYAELRASTGDPGRQLLSIKHKLQKGSASVIGQVTSKGSPAIALDTADATVIHRPNPYLPNTRSEMAVPLIVKNQVVGALDVQSNQPNAFDDDDVSVLTTLAAQISIAIDNARLFEQSGRRASEMSFLFGVTTAAASSDTLQNALQNVAQELLDSLNSLSVSIYLPDYDEEGDIVPGILRPVALAGSDQPLSELSEINTVAGARNLIASVAENRRPIIIGNIETEGRYLPVVESARSAVIVPLTSGAQFIGLITMESAELNAYDNETLTLLLTLSGTLSAIIQSQQLLEQVQRQNDELRALDRLKSDFLANMSHELRTPLNSIIGFSRVILKGIDGPLTEMQEQDLTTIYNSGQHLLNLINDILDQAKINANKMDLQFDYFDMKQVIDAVRSIGIGLVKDKPIDIFVETASGMPKAYGDEFRTRQILLNLVSNASKFTREGNIYIKVYTEPDENGVMMVRVDVVDSGIGIADNDIPLLFEAFRQVDSSLTRTVGGTGLGLPIAKSLVEMQGGRMMVASEVNVGSTFSITVPTEPLVNLEEKKKPTGELNGATGEVPAKKQEKPVSRKTIEHQPTRPPMTIKKQILIVEDNPDMVDQIRRALAREGYDIFAASIPLEAEAMASGLHPTIIIMDVNFTSGAGWDILAKLKGRDDTLDIPVIVVTLETDSERIVDAGAFRYIQRPFVPEVLVQAVQDADRESRIDRILIIDDQPESVRLMQQLLQEYGDYRVFSAHSGQAGIALVARRRPDLIVLDLRMPDMDGFAVVEELRANPETASIPILVVTGDSLTAEEHERLRNLRVLFKTDISLEQYLNFIEGVKTHLSKQTGD